MTHKLPASIWFSIILLSAFLVGYLSWAKATFNWPFDDTFYPYPETNRNVPSPLQGEGGGEVDLAGWLTYRNEIYGFELRYPKDWGFRTANAFGYTDGFFFSGKKSSISILPGGEFDYGPPWSEPNRSSGLLDGKPTEIREWLSGNGGLIWYKVSAGKPYWTSGNRIDISYANDEKELVDQILSTFRFIESREPAEVFDSRSPGYKTFSNPAYNYQVDFPDSWLLFTPNIENVVDGQSCLVNPLNKSIIIISKKQTDECGFVGEGVPDEGADIAIIVYDEPFSDINSILEPPVEHITVGREPAALFRFSYQQARPNVNSARIYFNHAGKGYLVFLKNIIETGDSYDPLYDQILSTFRFIE